MGMRGLGYSYVTCASCHNKIVSINFNDLFIDTVKVSLSPNFLTNPRKLVQFTDIANELNQRSIRHDTAR